MFLYTNGFWAGFNDKTNGVHVGFFKHILEKVFDDSISLTDDIHTADILLESHFGESRLPHKHWKYSIFFSGEGSIPIPNAKNYTCVMGAQRVSDRFVSCPLYAVYDYCMPTLYPSDIRVIPTKNICSVISSPTPHKVRIDVLNALTRNNIHIDNGGKNGNTIGYNIEGYYYEQPILDFYKQYRLVCAFENTLLDDYITEKIVNPFRAGTIPLYLGSDAISQYFNPQRFVEVNKDDIQITVNEINKLLTDDSYWLHKVNQPIFKQSVPNIMSNIIQRIKMLLI